MPSKYLQISDYPTFGVPNATEQQVTQASTLIDGYLKRPEGLVWSPDGDGNPCYMAAATTSFALTTTQDISPGQNVTVAVTGALIAVQAGFVAILDRENPSVTEACIITAVDKIAKTITLSNTQFPHESGTLLEFGLTIFEEKQMASGRPITFLSRPPVVAILSGQGRYGYPRRNDAANYALNQFNLLASITMFGGPPVWELFDQTLVDVDPNTLQVWSPAGILMAYYTEIRFNYIAGYSAEGLPNQIKQACANLINSASEMPLNGSIKSQRAGDTEITRFAATYIDNDTKALLDPFATRIMG